MNNEFTLFEKIWATLGIINTMLFIVGIVFICTYDELNKIFNFHSVGYILAFPCGVYLLLTLLLLVVDELILCKVWGLDVHIFPTLFKESNK